mmetsp:Transcript_31987/g.94101  ORF Transcript_31987/g.94101 Transcript_31987/m.94101 type:complete len:422 (-) Transcript_31987:600-1865(-)
MRQRRHEQSEVGIHAILELLNDGFQIVHQAQTKFAVLQQYPRPVDRAGIDSLDGHRFLTFTERDDGRCRKLLLAAQCLDAVGGVGTARQKENDGNLRYHAVVHGFNSVGDGLDVGRAHLLGIAKELLAHEDAAVHPQTSYQQQLEEGSDVIGLIRKMLLVGVSRDGHLLRLIVLVPSLPRRFVGRHLLNEIGVKGIALTQLHNVEPNFVAHPSKGLALHGGNVQRGTAAKEERHVAALELVSRHQDLHREEHDESELIGLVQASIDVPIRRVGHGVNDVRDALAGQRRLVGLVHGAHEQLEELVQTDLIHDVDEAHLHDAKVQHGPSRRRGTELLSLFGNVGTGFVGGHQLGIDFGSLGLGSGQYGYQLFVLEQIAGIARQALQQTGIELHQTLGIGIDFLQNLRQLLLQCLLLLANDLAQ